MVNFGVISPENCEKWKQHFNMYMINCGLLACRVKLSSGNFQCKWKTRLYSTNSIAQKIEQWTIENPSNQSLANKLSQAGCGVMNLLDAMIVKSLAEVDLQIRRRWTHHKSAGHMVEDREKTNADKQSTKDPDTKKVKPSIQHILQKLRSWVWHNHFNRVWVGFKTKNYYCVK